MRALRRSLWLGVALAFVLPCLAQQGPGSTPVSPDGSAVKEQTLLQQAPRIEGRIGFSRETMTWRAVGAPIRILDKLQDEPTPVR